MQLTSQKIAAIKALADDERGEPNTRAAAKAKLEQYRTQHPEMFVDGKQFYGESLADIIRKYPRSPPNPRTQPREDYSKWRFMDMGNWKHTTKGNPSIMVTIRGATYRVTMYRRNQGWQWVRHDMEETMFSARKCGTLREAQEDAWESLQTI